ncbi:MAG: hypothetical protein SVE93_07070 [Candidatus Thermoplasmatota archaeon]|nr:hypothetical protein [Candidatus Thermoplasmatota archaeon]
MNRKLLGITGVLALAISLIAVGSITAIGSAVEEKETAQSPLLEYRLNEAAGDMGFYTRNIDWEYEAAESEIKCAGNEISESGSEIYLGTDVKTCYYTGYTYTCGECTTCYNRN